MATKNKRLSGNDRTTLYNFAKKLVAQTEDTTALDAAYHIAAEAVRAELEIQFPLKDMKVLAKYEAAEADKCVYVSRGYYDRDQFCFRDGDKIPLRPKSRGCNYRTFGLEAASLSAFEDYQAAENAHKNNIEKRLDDYRALITGVNTFNDVAAAWPEAEKLRSTICGSGSAIMVLSNDVLERLKADPAASLAEAA